MLEFEKKFRALGKTKVAGIDEVGRGPLCGPVVASSVILPENIDIPGLTDSKKLSPTKRIRLYDEIVEKAVSIGVGIINEDRIDEINILNATIEAMILSIEDLKIKSDFLLVHGNMKNITTIPQESIIKGDSKSLSISRRRSHLAPKPFAVGTFRSASPPTRCSSRTRTPRTRIYPDVLLRYPKFASR